MAVIKKSVPKRAARKIVQSFGLIVIGAIIVLGFVFSPRQAQPAAQTEASVTLAPATMTPTSLPTQAKVVEEVQPSPTSTALATQVSMESINWVPLSTTGVSAPNNYKVGGICSSLPAWWILFTPEGEKETCDNPTQNLGDNLMLPAGAAVIPGYKLPETYLVQTAATGDDLEMPWEVPGVDDYWLRYEDTPEKLVRVCLIDEDNEITNTRSIELVVDEVLKYKPTGGGKCITALAEDVNLVVFSFLNEINNTIENGDYKFYEVILDPTIQGGVIQEVWLGGKPLSNN